MCKHSNRPDTDERFAELQPPAGAKFPTKTGTRRSNNPTNRTAMTQTMTKGEWVEASFNMAWCIYNNEDITAYRNGLKTDEDPLLTWKQLRLDFSAPAGTPDGVHKVQHQSKTWHRPRRRSGGQRRPVCARAHPTCGV